MKSHYSKSKKGFTLIEMLVAVGLFAVVMLIGTAVIFSIINGNRKSQTINNVVNNLNFSIESMIRDIKTGYWYTCDDYRLNNEDFSDLTAFKSKYMNQLNNPSVTSPYSCKSDTPVSHITFVSTLSGEPRIVEYFFSPADVTAPGRITKVYYNISNTQEPLIISLLTTPDINVGQFDLYINNPPPAFNTYESKSVATQPSVFLIVRGNAKIGNKDTDVSSFGVQTYISQRLLNI